MFLPELLPTAQARLVLQTRVPTRVPVLTTVLQVTSSGFWTLALAMAVWFDVSVFVQADNRTASPVTAIVRLAFKAGLTVSPDGAVEHMMHVTPPCLSGPVSTRYQLPALGSPTLWRDRR